MKSGSVFLSLTFVLLLSVFSAFADQPAQRVAKIDEARNIAASKKADCFVFVYGSDWNPLSVRYLERVWNSSVIENLLGKGAILTTFDQKQNMPPNELKEFRKSFSMPGWASYPCVVLFDSSWKEYGRIRTNDLPGIPVLLAAKIFDFQLLREKRDTIIEQANKSSSATEKARLLAEAASVGAGFPGDIVVKLKEIDPEDTAGVISSAAFNLCALNEANIKRIGEGKADQALKELEGLYAKTSFSPEKKQEVLAAKFSILKKTNADRQEILSVLKELESLNPSTVLGKAAAGIHKKMQNGD